MSMVGIITLEILQITVRLSYVKRVDRSTTKS